MVKPATALNLWLTLVALEFNLPSVAHPNNITPTHPQWPMYGEVNMMCDHVKCTDK